VEDTPMPPQEARPPLVVRAKAPFALLFLLGGVFFFACVVGLAALLLSGKRPVTWDVWAFFFGPVALFMGGFGALRSHATPRFRHKMPDSKGLTSVATSNFGRNGKDDVRHTPEGLAGQPVQTQQALPSGVA
jgi:hypothetical protein